MPTSLYTFGKGITFVCVLFLAQYSGTLKKSVVLATVQQHISDQSSHCYQSVVDIQGVGWALNTIISYFEVGRLSPFKKLN